MMPAASMILAYLQKISWLGSWGFWYLLLELDSTAQKSPLLYSTFLWWTVAGISIFWCSSHRSDPVKYKADCTALIGPQILMIEEDDPPEDVSESSTYEAKTGTIYKMAQRLAHVSRRTLGTPITSIHQCRSWRLRQKWSWDGLVYQMLMWWETNDSSHTRKTAKNRSWWRLTFFGSECCTVIFFAVLTIQSMSSFPVSNLTRFLSQ